MSPEMANLYKKHMLSQEVKYPEDLVTLDSDLYSIGILLFEIATGEPPLGYFRSHDRLEKEEYLNKVISSDIDQIIETKLGTYTSKFSEFVINLLKKDPSARLGYNLNWD